MKNFILLIFLFLGIASPLQSMEMPSSHQEKGSHEAEHLISNQPTLTTTEATQEQLKAYNDTLSSLGALLNFEGCEDLERWVKNKRRATYTWVKGLHKYLKQLVDQKFGIRTENKDDFSVRIGEFKSVIIDKVTTAIDHSKTLRKHAIRKQIGQEIPEIDHFLNTLINNDYNGNFNQSVAQPKTLLQVMQNDPVGAAVDPLDLFSNESAVLENLFNPRNQVTTQRADAETQTQEQGDRSYQNLLDQGDEDSALINRRSTRNPAEDVNLMPLVAQDEDQIIPGEQEEELIEQNGLQQLIAIQTDDQQEPAPVQPVVPAVVQPAVVVPAIINNQQQQLPPAAPVASPTFFDYFKDGVSQVKELIQGPEVKATLGIGAAVALVGTGLYKLYKKFSQPNEPENIVDVQVEKLDVITEFLENQEEGVPFNTEKFGSLIAGFTFLNKEIKESAKTNIEQLIELLNSDKQGNRFNAKLQLVKNIHLFINAEAIARYNVKKIDELIKHITTYNVNGKQYYSEQYLELVRNAFLLTHSDEHLILYEYATFGNMDFRKGHQNIIQYLEDIKAEMLDRAKDELRFFQKEAEQGKVTRLKAYLEDIKAYVVDQAVSEVKFMENCAARGNVVRLKEFISRLKFELPTRAEELSSSELLGKNINSSGQNTKEQLQTFLR